MVTIDGSYGEGGGQILRTALALSAVLGQPVHIEKIRAGRRNPGLQAQHVAGLKALTDVSRATVEGMTVGSTAVTFAPKSITPGTYRWDVGTAGAVTLVLQAVLVPLGLASGSSRIAITGGTHVPWSPTFTYVEQVLLPILARLGLRASLSLERWGFYPKGGGLVAGTIAPGALTPASLVERGALLDISGVSAVAGVPGRVAERQRDQALARLRSLGVPCKIDCASVEAANPGTVVFLCARTEGSRVGFSSLGERGKPAERVADEACDALLDHMGRPGALDPHLADQLLLPMVLARGSSALTTSRVTEHLRTNQWVVERFLPGRVTVDGVVGEPGRVRVEGGVDPPR